MAKRNRSGGDFPTLNKNIPDVLAYVVLVALFIAAVKIVRQATGVDY